jgi:hypothetical protein
MSLIVTKDAPEAVLPVGTNVTDSQRALVAEKMSTGHPSLARSAERRARNSPRRRNQLDSSSMA